ncbi:MAG: S8 family serine peptidase [Acidimicrobiaceae bacterium]|nr:S8 family serine peptidase [Acidimicrobiaceae bacterium]
MLLAAALFGAPAAAAVAARSADSPSLRSPTADAVPISSGIAAAQPIVERAEAPAATGGPAGGGSAPDGGLGLGEGLGDAELDVPGLGQADDGASVADLLGPGGVYTLNDGDREIRLRLLDPADAAVTGALVGEALHSGGSEPALEELAANAATAYSLSANATGAPQQVTPSNWLVSGSGQLFLLVGGVNVIFEPRVDGAEASAILAGHGVAAEHVSPLGELRGAFLVRTGSDVESLMLADALSSAPGVEFAAPNLFTPMSTETSSQSYASTTASTRAACTPYTEPWPDALSACLWHLNADTNFRYRGFDPTIDINLGDAWATTMGAGVTVAIIDQIWEATHEDLRDNVDLARSHVWGSFTGENQAAGYPPHGTAVAGIVGARDNAAGGRGVAPRATLVNYNLLDAFSVANQITAVTLNRETVAVYNLGYSAPGFPGAYPWGGSWRRAVDEGTLYGFGGKGSSYVKVAGNGSTLSGSNWATLDEANNHRGMIAVCAVDYRGQTASYSEDGPSLWVCAPSGDGGSGPAILVPIGKDGYSARFGGTSASAPIVSGVIALMRSANADLTWRDVKVILADTAQKNHASSSSWMSGAAKYGSSSDSYSFSNQYGFGTVDAQAAVQAATSWTLLPEMLSAEATFSTVTALPSRGHEIELSVDVDPGDMDFVEHVSVALTGDIYDIRDYEWTLVSPTGAESLLAPRATECRPGTCGLDGTFHFGSSRHLGEDPSGTWKLKIRKYAPDITHCVSDSVSYYGFWSIAQFCRKYRSYAQTVNAVQIVVSGHSSAAVSLQPVKVSVSPSRVAEGAEVEVSVTIEGAAPTQDVVIPLEITAGTATAAGLPGADYAALASITVPAGASSASAKLATVADGTDESDETFTVGLGTLPSGYRPVTGMPRVTIADDDSPPTVTLHAERPSVAEGDFVMITASLSHPSSQDVTLDVSAAAVAPAVPSDGSMSAWTELVIAAGTTASTYPVAFIASQNDVDEPLKEFSITAAATGGDVADPGAITVTIDDDAQPVVRPAAGSGTVPTVSIVADGNVIEGDTATFTLLANPRPTAPLTVSVMSSLWTERPEIQGNGGITTGARTVTIPLTGSAKLAFSSDDDEDWGFDLHLTAALQAGSGYALSSTADSAVLVVWENEYAPCCGRDTWAVGTVSVGSSGDSIVEGEDATFTITWNRPAVGHEVRVTWSFDGDFADDPARRATFWPDKRKLTKTFSIGTLDDGNVEAGGSVTFRLLPYWDHGYDLYYSVGTPDRATISVYDNDGDRPEVSISAGADVTEGGAAVFTVSASPAPAADLDVSVTVSDSGDFASTGQTGSRQVTIGAGETSATLTVATSDDDVDEADGSVTATVVAGAGYTVSAAQGVASVAVSDDDAALGGYVVDAGVVARVRALAAQAEHGAVHVNRWSRVLVAFGVLDGAGVSGGAMDAAEAQQMADAHSSPVWDEVVAELTALEASRQQTPPVADDDDPVPVVSVSGVGVGVVEGRSVWFEVSAVPAPSVGDRLLVGAVVSVSGGAVVDGVSAGEASLVWVSSGTVLVRVGTVNDLVAGGGGAVSLGLLAGDGYVLGADVSATVAVSDDDAGRSGPLVEVAAVGEGVFEGEDAVFSVSVPSAVTAPLSVAVDVSGVQAAGVSARTETVTIAAGQASAVLRVGTSDDAVFGGHGRVEAAVASGSGYRAGLASVADVTVLDDDVAGFSVSRVSIAGGARVSEGGQAVFTLSASPAPAWDVEALVDVEVRDGDGRLVWARTETVTIAAGTTAAVLEVAAAQDSVDNAGHGTVTAAVTRGHALGYRYGDPLSATVRVADDEDPEPPAVAGCAAGVLPALSISSPRASRSERSVDFEVSLGCKPAGRPTILVAPLRDGILGRNIAVSLSADRTAAAVTVPIGAERQLALALVWGTGLANRTAQGNVDYTD